MGDYDFSPLSDPVTPEDLKNYARNNGEASLTAKEFTRFAYVAAGGIGVVGIVVALQGQWFSAIMYGIFAGGLVFLAPKLKAVSNTKDVRFIKFAHMNGLAFGFNEKPSGFGGSGFKVGDDRQITQTLTLKDGSVIGNVTSKYSSNNKTMIFDWGFARITLEREVPQMLLDGRGENTLMGGVLDYIYNYIPSSDALELEGDFNKYFKLYAPRKHHADALYIFTPDVMASLIDSGASYDLELNGRELYIYRNMPFDFTNQSDMVHMTGIIDRIVPEIRNQVKRFGGMSPIAVQQPLPKTKTIELRQKTSLLNVLLIVSNVLVFLIFGWIFYVVYAFSTGDARMVDQVLEFLRF